MDIRKKLERNYAYSEVDKGYEKLGPTALIKLMYEKTDKKGWLVLPQEPYSISRGEERKCWREFRMSWTEEDRDQLIKEYRRLYKALVKMAELGPELGETRDENQEILSGEELEIWEKYIKDISDGFFEKDIERSLGRLLMDSDMLRLRTNKPKHWIDRFQVAPDEEIFRYWSSVDSINAKISKRIGGGASAFDIYIRAQRLYNLLVMEAPEKLINREAKRLVKAMAVNKYGKSRGSFWLLSAYALPIYKAKNVEAIREILSDMELYEICEESILDPGYAKWESIYYSSSRTAKELMEEYNMYKKFEDEYAITEIAKSINYDKELNPLGIVFEGIDSDNWYPESRFPFIVFFTDPNYIDKENKKFTKEEVMETLKRIAKFYGINQSLVGEYEIPT